MPRQSFAKTERLKSQKVIDALFQQGDSFAVYPLRIVYLEMKEKQGPHPVKFTLSVPKRSFAHAVDRNRLRRRLREAWRLNKQWLYDQIPDDKQYACMVLYTAKDELSYARIERAMRKVNRKLVGNV